MRTEAAPIRSAARPPCPVSTIVPATIAVPACTDAGDDFPESSPTVTGPTFTGPTVTGPLLRTTSATVAAAGRTSGTASHAPTVATASVAASDQPRVRRRARVREATTARHSACTAAYTASRDASGGRARAPAPRMTAASSCSSALFQYDFWWVMSYHPEKV